MNEFSLLIVTWFTIVTMTNGQESACQGRPMVLGEKRGDTSGVIYTPGFDKGQPYPEGASCQWLFAPNANMKLFLDFEQFDLGATKGCSGDKVSIKVIDASGLSPGKHVRVMCGSDLPRRIPLEAKGITSLDFTSDHYGENNGFKIRWQYTNQRPCPQSKSKYICSFII